MRSIKRATLLLLCFATALVADTKQETTTKAKIGGTLGTLAKMTGANKPLRQVQYLKGDILRTDRLDKKGKVVETQMVDLKRRVFVTINHKKKKYKEMTFEQWKEMLESGLGSIFSGGGQGEPGESEKPEAEVDWTFKLDIDSPGQDREIADKHTELTNLKLTLEAEVTKHEEGKEPQKGKGGMIVKSSNWMAKGNNEMQEFGKRMAEALGFGPGQTGLMGMLTKVLQNNEQLAAAMEKMQEEGDKLEGIPMETTTTFEYWGEKIGSGEGDKQEAETPKSVSGLFSKFAKKKMKKKDGKKDALMTTHMIVNYHDNSTLDPTLFDIPPYKKEEYTRK